jgi:hypothetical protein
VKNTCTVVLNMQRGILRQLTPVFFRYNVIPSVTTKATQGNAHKNSPDKFK